jgi:N utilization substance protein A
MNAKLASKLTGWRIDIKSQTAMAEEEESLDYDEEGEGVAGQCMAITGSGKRCPNQAVPGGRYCSIHAEQMEPAPEAPAAEETTGDAEAGPAEDEGE